MIRWPFCLRLNHCAVSVVLSPQEGSFVPTPAGWPRVSDAAGRSSPMPLSAQTFLGSLKRFPSTAEGGNRTTVPELERSHVLHTAQAGASSARGAVP